MTINSINNNTPNWNDTRDNQDETQRQEKERTAAIDLECAPGRARLFSSVIGNIRKLRKEKIEHLTD